MCVCVCVYVHMYVCMYVCVYIYIYIYIYCAVLKRLATPSDFHTPLPSIVPFAHSYISLTHRCIYPVSHPSLYISHLSPITVYIPSLTHRCI